MSNPYQGKEFCAGLSKLTGQEYRLPTEAEWEYTCRAVNSEQSSFISSESEINPIIYPAFYFGETITTDLANYCGKDRREYYKSKGTYADEPQGE